jgi:hypothetical protein
MWRFDIHPFCFVMCSTFTYSPKTSMKRITRTMVSSKEICKENILVMNFYANSKREWTKKNFSVGKDIRIPLNASLSTASCSVTGCIWWHCQYLSQGTHGMLTCPEGPVPIIPEHVTGFDPKASSIHVSDVVWSRFYSFTFLKWVFSWSQWPRGLRLELSSLARTLGSWVRILFKVLMSVCVYCVCGR